MFCMDQSEKESKRFTLSRRVRWIQAVCGLALLVTVIAEGQGAKSFDHGVGFVLQLVLLVVVLAVLAFDFVKSGRRS